MQKRVCAFLVTLTLLAPAQGIADPTSVGVQLGATHGTHRETGGSATAPLVPVPILHVNHTMGCAEVSAEGLPPMGPISFGNNGLGMKDITLSYADAVMRWWNPSHTVAVGAGDTLYNQRTDFLQQFSRIGQRAIIDRSRVAGTRYEVTARRSIGRSDSVQVQFAVNPAMHGRFTESTPFGMTQPISERASQVDADAHVTHDFGQYAFSYGVRYLNYNAAFDSWLAQSQFADANALVMPYVAFERTFDGPHKTATNANTPVCARPRIPIQLQAFVGGELFTGAHQDFDGAVRGTTVASVPLYALRARHNQYELMLQDVPPVGPIPGAARFPGSKYNVKAGYGAVSLRYWERAGGFGFGIGDSLYVSRRHAFAHTYIATRAAGLRYEILHRSRVTPNTQMLAVFAFSPSMHQRGGFWYDDIHSFGGYPSFGMASLVDASLQFETAQGQRHAWVYGLRYLNYAGGNYYKFDRLKDRTGVIGGFAAWGFPLGQ